ncbi:hypothetical protein CEP52_002194 [Fusarium oligoseptatum]|uniref:Uncharacterized protein n=1 Tax=Fusarium oligoseptatum TaxID=2604345 RepID=A0A428UFB9_9HYPO|nr:hypothetical protein CEP52_002194 [Fusarium oligoseptatum]
MVSATFYPLGDFSYPRVGNMQPPNVISSAAAASTRIPKTACNAALLPYSASLDLLIFIHTQWAYSSMNR